MLLSKLGSFVSDHTLVTDICDHPTAGEDIAKFWASMFHLLHEGTPNNVLKGVVDLAMKSVVDVVMKLADERIAQWADCIVSLQLVWMVAIR